MFFKKKRSLQIFLKKKKNPLNVTRWNEEGIYKSFRPNDSSISNSTTPHQCINDTREISKYPATQYKFPNLRDTWQNFRVKRVKRSSKNVESITLVWEGTTRDIRVE